MFDKTSLAGSGWIFLILGLLARFFELDLDEGAITETGTAVVLVISFLGALWGQFRRKDLTFGLFRKNTE